MEALIHLKTTESFQEKQSIEKSKQIIQAFEKACLQLDARLFEPFMHEDDCFEDMDKYRFLDSLKSQFENMQKRTAEEVDVLISHTVCRGCSFGKPVRRFTCYSMASGLKIGSFGYLIDIENGILKDIYQCNGIELENYGFHKEIEEKLLSKYRK